MAKFLKLENVEETAKKNSDTFFIPSLENRKKQGIGDSVRLHFLLEDPAEDDPRAERMWVTITRKQGWFRPFRGTLENEPVYIDDLNEGDEVEFKLCHVAQTVVKKGDPDWIDAVEKKALVSQKCFEDGECVRFLYREQADKDEDSGWRMFAGGETDEYNSDINNIRIVNVGWMLDKDPSLLEPLKQGLGAVFERETQVSKWQRVTDWLPSE